MSFTPPRAWRDDELVPISALEHWSYCPRQCALIHLEQTYDENLYTLRGNRAHRGADEAGVRSAPAACAWSAPCRSGRSGSASPAAPMPSSSTPRRPTPLSTNPGNPRTWAHEAVQVCAQALCLEEMLGVAVPVGAVWYHGSRQRREIELDAALRAIVEESVVAVRAMLAGSRLPAAPNDAALSEVLAVRRVLAVTGRPPGAAARLHGRALSPGAETTS